MKLIWIFLIYVGFASAIPSNKNETELCESCYQLTNFLQSTISDEEISNQLIVCYIN